MQLFAGQVDMTADLVFAVRGQLNGTAERFRLMLDIGKSYAAGGFAGAVEFGRVSR